MAVAVWWGWADRPRGCVFGTRGEDEARGPAVALPRAWESGTLEVEGERWLRDVVPIPCPTSCPILAPLGLWGVGVPKW